MNEKSTELMKNYINGIQSAGNDLSKIVFGEPIGVCFYVGKFLVEKWKPYSNKEQKEVERIYLALKSKFDSQGHSGTSAVAATAILLGNFNNMKEEGVREGLQKAIEVIKKELEASLK